MKTTINAEELRELDACEEGYQTFIEAHNLATVKLSEALESNGVEDVCWLLAKMDLTKRQDSDLRSFARQQALINIKKIVPYCITEDYVLILHYLKTGDSGARSAAESAASAAWSAADSAASSAAWGAAESAAWSSAESAVSAASAARSAASAVSAASAARSAFKDILLSWEIES